MDEQEQVQPDPENPRIERDEMLVHQNESATDATATPAQPAPDPEVVAAALEKLNTRITAKFAYEKVTDVVAKLLEIADMPAGTISGDERQVSMISFEDEPLRYCLERLRHMVSGVVKITYEGAVDFSFEAGS